MIDCPDGATWERVQRTAATNPDEFNGFAPGFEEVVDGEIWTLDEYVIIAEPFASAALGLAE